MSRSSGKVGRSPAGQPRRADGTSTIDTPRRRPSMEGLPCRSSSPRPRESGAAAMDKMPQEILEGIASLLSPGDLSSLADTGSGRLTTALQPMLHRDKLDRLANDAIEWKDFLTLLRPRRIEEAEEAEKAAPTSIQELPVHLRAQPLATLCGKIPVCLKRHGLPLPRVQAAAWDAVAEVPPSFRFAPLMHLIKGFGILDKDEQLSRYVEAHRLVAEEPAEQQRALLMADLFAHIPCLPEDKIGPAFREGLRMTCALAIENQAEPLTALIDEFCEHPDDTSDHAAYHAFLEAASKLPSNRQLAPINVLLPLIAEMPKEDARAAYRAAVGPVLALDRDQRAWPLAALIGGMQPFDEDERIASLLALEPAILEVPRERRRITINAVVHICDAAIGNDTRTEYETLLALWTRIRS